MKQQNEKPTYGSYKEYYNNIRNIYNMRNLSNEEFIKEIKKISDRRQKEILNQNPGFTKIDAIAQDQNEFLEVHREYKENNNEYVPAEAATTKSEGIKSNSLLTKAIGALFSPFQLLANTASYYYNKLTSLFSTKANNENLNDEAAEATLVSSPEMVDPITPAVTQAVVQTVAPRVTQNAFGRDLSPEEAREMSELYMRERDSDKPVVGSHTAKLANTASTTSSRQI